MTLTASDLVLYGSTGRPTDDATVTGGGIDLTARPISQPLSSAAGIELLSSSSGDERTFTVAWRSTTLGYREWDGTLAGTSAVAISTGTPKHLLSVALSSASTAYAVSVRVAGGGAAIHVIGPGEVEAFRMFQGAYSSHQSAVSRYEKLFLKNTSTEYGLSSAFVYGLTIESPAPFYSIGLSTALDSTDGWANRLTDPGYTFQAVNTSSGGAEIPGGALGPGEAIGIGVEQVLQANTTDTDQVFLVVPYGKAITST